MPAPMYLALVGDKSFEIDQDMINALDLVALQEDHYHLIQDGKSLEIKLLHIEEQSKTLTIEINGQSYTTVLKDGLDQMIEKMGMYGKRNQVVDAIKAPMPGLVLEIMVESGQQVEEGDPVIILEAMKMENVLKAPHAVTIGKIHTNKGNAVDKNEVLISFE